MNDSMIELRETFQAWLQQQVVNLDSYTPEPSQCQKTPIYYDDDDDEESSTPLRDIIISELPSCIAITPVLSTEEPKDSLIMGDERLDTIPEKESDEFIKSSVENLVSNLSEFEDTSESDSECILPSCDDFSPINIFEEKSVTFSNPLFYFKDEYISSDVNPLFDKVLENIESKDYYDSNLHEPDLLVTLLFDANEDECFDPGCDIDEIDAFLDADVSTDTKDGYHDSEGDIIYLKSLLLNDNILNLPPKVFLDHDPRIFKDEPDNYDFKSMVKVFDPGIHDQIFSPTYVSLPFTDHHYLFFTYVVRILLLYFTYPVVSPFLLSFGSEDTIFDPGIFVCHFSLALVASHRSGTFMCFNVYSNILNESSIEICSSTHFYPNITTI
uniref:Reverse transcriptase domain-containing protein n=1 Tax=Tanacetum cinerariifolium TaxID=118510 RepID=A0A699HF72_TANCI|nr:hypothetical protein [Tanacetum cinerariifolium]